MCLILVNRIKSDMEREKEEEIRKKLDAKNNLKIILQENEANKKRQVEDLRREREEDIRSMEQYTRILDKQEQDRANYFKNCENRQNEHMSRMANTVIKQHDERMKQEEEKNKQYQEEKNRR